MAPTQTFIGWLLVGGTVVGLAFVGHPALIRVWNMPREQHVATVAEHRVVWVFLNAGFVLATVTTAAAIVAMSVTLYAGSDWSAAMLTSGVVYAMGGVLWCAALAIRTRTTPLLHQLGPESYSGQPVRVLDAVSGGLFDAFVVICGVALTALGLALLLAGGLSVAVCLVCVVVGVGLVAWLLIAGDVIPAALYLPTLLIGIGLLAGWQ